LVAELEERLPSILTEAEQTSSSRILKRLGSVLILQAPADEAWLGLTIPALGMWMNRGLGWILARAWKIIFISFGIGLGTFVFLGSLIGLWQRFWPNYMPPGSTLESLRIWLEPISSVALWLVYIAPIQGLVWVALALIGALTLRFLGYGFLEGIGLTISTEVHVEHYPAGGRWEIFCPSQPIKGLHHAIYESTEVQAELMKWLSRCKRE
jgi:hypothetical protein